MVGIITGIAAEYAIDFLNPKVQNLTYSWEGSHPKLTWTPPKCRLPCVSSYIVQRDEKVFSNIQDSYFLDEHELEADRKVFYRVSGKNLLGGQSDATSVQVLTQPKAPKLDASLPFPRQKTVELQWSDFNKHKKDALYYMVYKKVGESLQNPIRADNLFYFDTRKAKDYSDSVSYWIKTVRKETTDGEELEIPSESSNIIRIAPIIENEGHSPPNLGMDPINRTAFNYIS